MITFFQTARPHCVRRQHLHSGFQGSSDPVRGGRSGVERRCRRSAVPLMIEAVRGVRHPLRGSHH
eukprot:5789400-Alexandrium_andersonii.AAC.1